jgi:hypothetical protein
MPPIVVPNLRVESVTGPTCYSAEDGFSALTAFVKADDAVIVNQLIRASEDGATVTVRCATLEVEGKVGKFQFAKGETRDTIAIAVDDLRYFKPHRKF